MNLRAHHPQHTLPPQGGRAIRSIAFLWLCAALLPGSACDKIPLLAPTSSTISVTAPVRILALSASTEVTAVVQESGGQPVQNGTTVRFTASLGRVDPAEVVTRNGSATTTFFAGETSGLAEVRASSGAAGGGTAAAGSTATNVITFTIGAAATDSVTVRANPASVGFSGGTVDIIATVLGENGRALSGVPVTFSANHGTLSSSTATSDANGEALVRLTTNVDTSITASAGGKNATAVTVTVAATESVTVRANPASVGFSGGTVDIIATVLGANGRALSGVPVTFSANHGTLSSSTATSDVNGEALVRLTTNVDTSITASAGGKNSTAVTVTVLGTPLVTLTCQGSGAAPSNPCTQLAGQPVTFTAGRGTGTTAIASATIEFGDGAGSFVGTLTSATTVTHTYSSAGNYAGTLRATDVNGQSTSASVAVSVTAPVPKPPLGVTFSTASADGAATPVGIAGNAVRWNFTATATPAADILNVESYAWDFGDGTENVATSGSSTSHVYTGGPTVNGRKVVTVTIRTIDGRTATGRTEIIVSGLF